VPKTGAVSHRIELAPAGEQFQAEPGETVLDAALRHGLNLPHSCRGGSCLSCRARLLEGAVDYPKGTPPALSEADREDGFALLCQAHARCDLRVETRPIEIPGDIRIRRLPYRVETIDRPSHDVAALRLKLPGFEPFEFLPGQYVDILLSGGRRRSFSMANPPHETGVLELHVRRVPGGDFTARVFDRMKPRDLLRLEGPLGQFYLREDSPRPMIFVAGGTGFAPIKSMLRHWFEASDQADDRPVHLYWGVRAARDLYDSDTARGLARERPSFSFTPVLSSPATEDGPEWRTGLVHEAVLADRPDLSGHDVYVCGPPPLIEAARRDFQQAGLPDSQLFFDSFDYAAPDPVRPEAG
jgi:CDP-4-dehydro-6-deoxyglucose reductase